MSDVCHVLVERLEGGGRVADANAQFPVLSAEVMPASLDPNLPNQPADSRAIWLWSGLALLPVNVAPSLLLMVWGIGQWLRMRWRRLTSPMSWDPLHQLSAVVVVVILAVTWAGETLSLSLPGSFNYWPFVGMMVACRQPLACPQMRLRVVRALLGGGILIAVLGLGQALGGWHYRLGWDPIVIALEQLDHRDRPTALFLSPNTLAVYLVMLQAVAVGLLVAIRQRPAFDSAFASRYSSWDPRLALSFLLLSLPLVGLTASRNGWGIAWAGLVIGLVWFHRWRWLAGLLGLTALPVGAAVGILGLRQVIPSLFWQRLADTLDPQATYFSSTANRVDGWQFALDMMMQRPWTGWGWQSFQDLYNAQMPAPPEWLTHPHNLYLMVGSEGGILVLAGLLALWGILLGKGWRQAAGDPLTFGVVLALSCYFLSGLLDVVALDARVNIVVWVLLSWCGSRPLQAAEPSRSHSESPGENLAQT